MHAAKVKSSVLFVRGRCTRHTLSVWFVLHNDEMDSVHVESRAGSAAVHVVARRCSTKSNENWNRERYLENTAAASQPSRYWLLLLLLDFCARRYGQMMKTNFKLESVRDVYVCEQLDGAIWILNTLQRWWCVELAARREKSAIYVIPI